MHGLTDVKVNIKLPYIGSIEGTWTPNKKEKDAAWEMYIELITRISVAELKSNEGLLRESLSSLYALFGKTRDILCRYGPSVAINKNKVNISFGYIAVAVLNSALRPILSKWHPLLLDYESKKESNISVLEHENQWEEANALRKDLNNVRKILINYAEILEKVAGVPSLIIERKE